MAKLVLTAQFVTVNAQNLQSFCRKAEVAVDVDEKETTVFTSAGWKEHIGGLKAGEIALEFLQDFDAAALDSIMWPLLGLVVPFEVRATQAARSTSNPAYTGSVLVNAWNPLQGSVGDLAEVSVTYPTSGAVNRLTA